MMPRVLASSARGFLTRNFFVAVFIQAKKFLIPLRIFLQANLIAFDGCFQTSKAHFRFLLPKQTTV